MGFLSPQRTRHLVAIGFAVVLIGLPKAAAAQPEPPGEHQRPNTAPAPTPDAQPVPADTTQLPIARIADPATPDGGIGADLMDIDQAAYRLYVSNHNSDGVDVFDVSGPTPAYITTVGGLGGAEGIVTAPDIKEVFAATPSGALAVIDANPISATGNAVLASVQVAGSGLDTLEYDPGDHKVYVTVPGENTIGVVDTDTNTVIKTFTGLPSGLEQPRYNSADGMLYVVVRDANMLLQFDPSTDALVRETELPVECGPNGLAINPANDLALLGCSTQHTVFWDLAQWQIAGVVDNIGSGDAAIYDSSVDRFMFAAQGFHRGPVIGFFDGDGQFLTNVPTTTTSHQIAFDETNRMVYTVVGPLGVFPLP
jgi:YVTN family beta-propeller protein